MNQTSTTSLTQAFGPPNVRVHNAVEALAKGGGVLVVDDENRENEGDLIFAADSMTVEQMALMIRECTGIVCLSLPSAKLDALALPQMVRKNSARMGTAFTVSIEAKEGVTTGVSAADRVQTIRTAIADGAKPEDLARPGHVFPLRAHPAGIQARPGHTEASLALVEMAGHSPAAVLCELTNPDGTMARLPEIMAFAEANTMPVVTIEDLLAMQTEATGRVA